MTARGSRLRAPLIALLLLAQHGVAHASPLFELAGSAHGPGGLCARGSTPSAASAYFNPALLPDAAPGLELGLFALIERIDADADARSSAAACDDGACDVPEVNGAGPESFRHEDGSPLDAPTLPTAWLEEGRDDADGEPVLAPRPRQGASTGRSEHAYVVLGLVQPLIRERASLGLYTALPLSDFVRTRAFYADEREQFFSHSLHPELYGDRLTTISLAAGLGARLFEQLSVGLSLSLSIASAAHAPVYVPNLADLDTLLLDSDVGVSLSLAPHVGVSYTPLPRLRLSATVHSPQSVEIETSFRYVVATGIEQRAGQSFTHGYLPWIFALAAELELLEVARHRVALAGTGSYALWSKYRDRHRERPRGDYAWSDTPAASLGVRYDFASWQSFLDLGYTRSPVPEQSGRSNYVDGDRGSVSAGTRYAFPFFSSTAHVGLHAQAHRIFPERARKREGDDRALVRDELPDDAVGGLPRGPIEGAEGLQTNNPGYPGFGSDGYLLGGGVTLGIAY